MKRSFFLTVLTVILTFSGQQVWGQIISNNQPLIFKTNNVEAMRIDVAGAVGIGTTSPQFGAKLEVVDRVNIIGSGTSRMFIAKDGNEYLDISYNAGNTRGEITTFNSSQPLILQQLGGNVGIGTTSPLAKLDVVATTTNVGNNTARFEAPNIGNNVSHIHFGANGDWFVRSASSSGKVILQDTGGAVGIGTTSPGYPLEMGSGAHVTGGGVWTNASSRQYKENIRDLTVEEAMTALRELQPSRFNYKIDKEEEHVGFIAEDVPDLLANKDRNGLSPMDIVAVLTKVVQEQQKKIEALEARLDGGQ